ncbi:MAG: TIGR03118 family protein [Verrucomicrobia bacterium]|nr:TIGR03118 family protein [Verrucomicrobiota bacterium]
MKEKFNCSRKLIFAGLLALAALPTKSQAVISTNQGYVQVDLVSDSDTNAAQLDPQLLNPWGIVAGPGAVWINDNHSSQIATYGPLGKPLKYKVHVPAPGGGDGAPTGLVFNDTAQFVITNGMQQSPATFLLATEDGTIAAWNNSVTGTNAMIVVDNSGSGAVYKGLAIVRDADGAPQVYAADFHNGKVDVYDGQFHFVKSFTDPDVPLLFAPFNVRNIRGRVFVTFAKQLLPDKEDDQAGLGNGFVDIFDTDGTLLRRFASQGTLNSPWGMAIAPRNFGHFSHALLVGNFGDGRINAYDLLTGKFLGQLKDANGDVIEIEGLWGLTFDRDEQFERESSYIAQRLYFTAGTNDEADGLFGFIRPISPFLPAAR